MSSFALELEVSRSFSRPIRTIPPLLHPVLLPLLTPSTPPSTLHALITQCLTTVGLTPHIPLFRFDGEFSGSLTIHPYRIHGENKETGGFEEGEEGEEGEGEGARHVAVPCRGLDGAWEVLVYDSDVKNELLEYVNTAMVFAERGVDERVVACGRVVLLHGPPGTGKTSLCRALAHKLAVRLAVVYPAAVLVEVNAHSLFSKWFSESGKLVGRLFQSIGELADGQGTFVVVVIDEVESLTAARTAAMSGSEPSDAIRVVNAVLTQLDALRARKNVLVLTTSNITGAIDLAFVDRADMKVLVGLPGAQARYAVLVSCLQELVRSGVVAAPTTDLPASQALLRASFDPVHLMLAAIVDASEGLSGRMLRKVPFLAHAFFLAGSATDQVGFEHYLTALERAIHREKASRADLLIKA